MELLTYLSENPSSAITLGAILIAIGAIVSDLAKETGSSILRGMFSAIQSTFVTTYEVITHSSFWEGFNIWRDTYPSNILWTTRTYAGSDYSSAYGRGTNIVVLYDGWVYLISVPFASDESNKPSTVTTDSVVIQTPFATKDKVQGFLKMLENLRKGQQEVQKRTSVYTLDSDMDWRQVTIGKREMDHVYLPKTMKDRVVNIVSDFFSERDWYENRSVPHRMGIMLKGLPGTGKTSLAKSLSTHFEIPLYIVPITLVDDYILPSLMSDLLTPCFVLFEDLSAVDLGKQSRVRGTNDDDDDDVDGEKLTLTGFLNAIDGVLSPQNVVYLYTANEIDSLDPAILRPGRVDMIEDFTFATKEQARDMFVNFFPGSNKEDAFAEAFPEGVATMAQVQFSLFTHRKDLDSCISWAKSLADKPSGKTPTKKRANG